MISSNGSLIAGTTHAIPPRRMAVALDYPDVPRLEAEVEAQDFNADLSTGWFCCSVILPDPKELIPRAEDTIRYQGQEQIGLHQATGSSILAYAASCLNSLMNLEKTDSRRIGKSFGTQHIGPSDGLALSAVWRCLIFRCRRLVSSYVAFRSFAASPATCSRNTTTETKLQTGTDFYHYMTSIYVNLFRSTAPLHTDLRVDKSRELAGHDQELVPVFVNVPTESFYFLIDDDGSKRIGAPIRLQLFRLVPHHDSGDHNNEATYAPNFVRNLGARIGEFLDSFPAVFSPSYLNFLA
ncbi:hypothetical protein GMORB2_6110 [Geosmithia morbida]|uniref:Uncharacterized protein n=1 Tax=Geosmithia morbida TaxID=1094350 RepID=A0A9P5D6D9_9HYPO|nr:uncharacterized protein GMORB2_6110 [Geosmithia morbida]KAF4123409.1 hypothetical protein GMORB2_6110 [Geosmithia morbida]